MKDDDPACTDSVAEIMRRVKVYGQCRANWQGLTGDQQFDAIGSALRKLSGSAAIDAALAAPNQKND